MHYCLAIDIGASSGRHMLSHVENGTIHLEEVYRFDNLQCLQNGHDCWDINHLWEEILAGMARCKELGKIPQSIGIDTWAVDFVLVDEVGRIVGDPVAYRDGRTQGVRDQLEVQMPFAQHYAQTGIQYQPFNTVYQLCALQKYAPEQLAQAHRMLMIPDYFHYLLTGVMVQEYTNATSTALVNAHTNQWDTTLIDRLGLPHHIFGGLQMPGSLVGDLLPAISKTIGYTAQVVLPATHDTGSAFLAVPATSDTALYISSGTWSLMGVELRKPITSAQSMVLNFTNEGGYQYRYRYLKNIMGLWMIQSIRRELNGVNYVTGKEQRTKAQTQYSFVDLERLAQQCTYFTSVIDVDDVAFLAPESMTDAVKVACQNSNQPVPNSVGELMQCVYLSLAKKYKLVVEQISALTHTVYDCIHIVGGGCQSQYLNVLCAQETGLPVLAGPIEGTALGNAMVQLIANGQLSSLEEGRKSILTSFEIKEYTP